MKSRTSLSIVFVLLSAAILIVCLNAWLAFRSVESLSESNVWVTHSWHVIESLEVAIYSLKDAESAARGFLLTGQQPYRVSYDQAKAELPGELQTLAGLIADNPTQKANLRELRAAIESRLSLLDQGVHEREAGALDPISLRALIESGSAQTGDVRSLADRMRAAEQALLTERTTTSRLDIRDARDTVIFSSIADLSLLLLMSRYIVNARRLSRAEQDARRDAESKADEVRVLNAELEERVRQRTAELESANRELEAFSYSVSHDLRAPLRTIDGFSLALEEDYGSILEGNGQDYLRRIRNSVQRMGQLIDSLLQLSRITRAELICEPVDLSALAAAVAAELTAQNPTRAIAIEIEPGLQCAGDPRLLRAALENLLGNAVKFTARQAEARIQLGRSGNSYFIRDNGVGFDMRYADKLFNAFNRLHGDKDFRGSGVGLATVARIIRRQNGNIWAESELGQGATFWFTLGEQ